MTSKQKKQEVVKECGVPNRRRWAWSELERMSPTICLTISRHF